MQCALVDGHERDPHAAERRAQAALEPFRRDVDQLVLPGAHAAQALAACVGIERRVHDGGAEAAPHERVDLILHQGDERAHDQDRPGRMRAGIWNVSDLPAPVGITADAVAPGEHGADDLLLAGRKSS